MFNIGEALVGGEPNLAHIDLVIGNKDGPAGQAFLDGLTQLSKGHTPLLGVIRPNLPTKPSTLIVPKVTVEDMDDADKIFGPAQEGVARAVADSVEEGIIPEEEVDDLVIIVSVFIHSKADDYQKINRFNYGATRLAISRAMKSFPSIDKVLKEKDKAGHPIMGNRTIKLKNPPYIQIAMDKPDIDQQIRLIREVPDSDHLLFEAGTPLIKKYGISIVEEVRKECPDAFVIADLKTLDTGHLETRLASDTGADAVVVSGLADESTIEKSVKEADKCGIYCIVDTLNVSNPLELLENVDEKPHIVELHRGIDAEYAGGEHSAWGDIPKIKKMTKKNIVSVAGGITEDTIENAVKSGADVLVVGRAIANSKDPRAKTIEFLDKLETAWNRLKKEKFGDIEQFRWRTDF